MSRVARFGPDARKDVEQAVARYGEERAALALAFAESLDALIARVCETPLQFPAVRGEIRRALLGRFPYGVFFTIKAESIDVLAVLHLHRHPDHWKERQ
jgi:plasmid stabilization system protein ParE